MSDLTIEGERELLTKIDDVINKVEEAKIRALKVCGMNIIATAQDNLKKNKSINTGQLRDSGRVQKIGDGFEVGFFSQGTDEGHAAIVEYGSDKSWFPPINAIMDWLKGKYAMPLKESTSVAFAIAMTMAGRSKKHPNKHGLSPHPFFEPSVKKEKKNIEKIFKKELGDI